MKKTLDNSKSIKCKLRFTVSFRFRSFSLSSLVDNLSEIYNKECRGCKERKIKSEKRQLKPIRGLIKKFPNTYEFCNGDIN